MMFRRITLFLALLTIAASPVVAATDSLWDSRPYQIAIRIDFSESDLSESQGEQLRDRLVERLDYRLGRFWQTDLVEKFKPSPADRTTTEPASDATGQTPESEATGPADQSTDYDKQITATIRSSGIGGTLHVVEHDVTLDHRGVPIEMAYAGAADLPERLYSAILAAFRPIARFVRDPTADDRVTLSYRAAELAPTLAAAGASNGELLLPFRRRVDRDGRPVADGTKTVRWTYLIANQPVEGEPFSAEVISHTRRPFGSRPSAMLQQLALVTPVNPQLTTVIKLTSIEDPTVPLPGYEVELAQPGEEVRESLAFSDEKGEVALPHKSGVWMAHIKCGNLTVASVPVAPGVDTVIEAPLVDERSRLRAELEVTSLREELVDTVARRKILGQRIRNYVEDERPDAAASLLDEMDDLRGRTQFTRDLSVIERGASADHPVAQQRIDQLFEKMRSLINSALDPRESRDLSQLVSRAKRDAEIRQSDKPAASTAESNTPGG